MLRRGHSGLVWFEHEMGDAATKLLAEFLQSGCRLPFIVLAELADEKAVAEIIQAGAWDCAEKSLRNGADLLRTIRCTRCDRSGIRRKTHCASFPARSSNPPIPS